MCACDWRHGRFVGSDGRAQLHGDWVLGCKSRGCFRSLMLLSSTPSTLTATAEAQAASPASSAASALSATTDDHDRAGGGGDTSGLEGEDLSGGFWGRWAAGEGEGVQDVGALPMCLRVEGGPWLIDFCHVLSESGIPVSVDDPQMVRDILE